MGWEARTAAEETFASRLAVTRNGKSASLASQDVNRATMLWGLNPSAPVGAADWVFFGSLFSNFMFAAVLFAVVAYPFYLSYFPLI